MRDEELAELADRYIIVFDFSSDESSRDVYVYSFLRKECLINSKHPNCGV
jgi:hypothetical protein